MANRSLNVEGIQELKAAMRRYGKRANHALSAGLYREAEEIIGESKELVPVDTSALRNSGHVQMPEERRGVVHVALGFGGPAGSGNHGGQTNEESVGYAIYVHEDLTKRHPVGQAKYLSAPAERRATGMAGRIAVEIERELER